MIKFLSESKSKLPRVARKLDSYAPQLLKFVRAERRRKEARFIDNFKAD